MHSTIKWPPQYGVQWICTNTDWGAFLSLEPTLIPTPGNISAFRRTKNKNPVPIDSHSSWLPLIFFWTDSVGNFPRYRILSGSDGISVGSILGVSELV